MMSAVVMVASSPSVLGDRMTCMDGATPLILAAITCSFAMSSTTFLAALWVQDTCDQTAVRDKVLAFMVQEAQLWTNGYVSTH